MLPPFPTVTMTLPSRFGQSQQFRSHFLIVVLIVLFSILGTAVLLHAMVVHRLMQLLLLHCSVSWAPQYHFMPWLFTA